MNLKTLEAVITVAEHGSIASAAEAMYISPPALLQQMNRLEGELGFKLFTRGPGGVTLTAAGTLFLEGAKQMRLEIESLLERCREAAAQSTCIRIGAIMGLKPDLYPRISGAFRERYPDIIQKPVMESEEQLFADLDEGRLDAFEYYDCPRIHTFGRRFEPLIYEGRDCLMSASHPLARRSELTLEDLQGQRLIVYNFERIPGFREVVEKDYPQIILGEAPQMVDYYSLLRSFEDGHLSLVPPHCKEQFAPLVAVPLRLDLEWAVGLVYREPASAVLEDFLEVARQVFHKGE